MSFSLNEVEVTAKKAARGAGYPWGLAEEAGKATRWLCAQGLDGCGALAGLLDAGFAEALTEHGPKTLSGVWQGNAALCPLFTGSALTDCAARLRAGPLELAQVAQPMLLLPFAAAASRQLATALVVEGPGFRAATDGTRLHLDGEIAPAASITLGPGPMPEDLSPPLHTRATPEPEAWDRLNAFAHRTYAPATEDSRLRGAGAGLSDND